MPIPATIMLLDRSPRRDVTLPATARRNGAPIDIEISDLSTTGFRATSATLLDVGSEVSIGWAMGGRHEAIVVRSDATGYGCEFKRSLPSAIVVNASTVSNVVPIGVETMAATALSADPPSANPAPMVEVWTSRSRLALVAAAAVSSWGLVGIVGYATYALLN